MPKLVTKAPFLKNTRLNFNVLNVFDFTQKVKDATGDTPIAYERDQLNPFARRSINVSINKQF